MYFNGGGGEGGGGKGDLAARGTATKKLGVTVYRAHCFIPLRQVFREVGGTGGNRTHIYGFAVRCITTLPPRQVPGPALDRAGSGEVS